MSVLLCSHNESVRERWHRTLSRGRRLHQAKSLEEILMLVSRVPVSIILLHRPLVDDAGLRRLVEKCTGVKVFVLTDRPDDDEGVLCLRLGSVGYANTYIAPAKLRAAVEAVESGLVYTGTSVLQRLIKGLTAGDEGTESVDETISSDPRFQSLSRRELQIAGLVADGLQNREVAEQLGISERTVKAHLTTIYQKTKSKGRLGLALMMKAETQVST